MPKLTLTPTTIAKLGEAKAALQNALRILLDTGATKYTKQIQPAWAKMMAALGELDELLKKANR